MTNSTTPGNTKAPGFFTEDWKPYVRAGKIGLIVIWTLVILYLLFWPSTYTSTWALLVLGKDAAVNVNLQGVGQASTDQPPRAAEFQDPRDDYVYIATSLDVLTQAAGKVDLDVNQYGEPSITTDRESAIISLETTGSSPEQAQDKAKALYEVLYEKIESLRLHEVARRKAETLKNLEGDQNVLLQAQDNLAKFKANSSFHSESQLTSLSAAVEGLRTTRAEKIAVMKGIEEKLAQFSRGTTVSEPSMHDVYVLQADPVYQKQLVLYADVFARYSNLVAELGYNNPTLLSVKGELDSALFEMRQRASFLLKKEVTERFLIYLNSVEWVTARGEYETLEAETKELENQITELDKRLTLLDQEQNSFSRIQTDFQVAESILAGTLARLNYNQSDIYAIYPPIQLIVQPNLPDERSSPDMKISLLAGIAFSFILTALLVFLKWERNSPWRNPRAWIP